MIDRACSLALALDRRFEIVWNAVTRRVYGAPVDSSGIRRFVLIGLILGVIGNLVGLVVDYPAIVDRVTTALWFGGGTVLWVRQPPTLNGERLPRLLGPCFIVGAVGALVMEHGPEEFVPEHPSNLGMTLITLAIIGGTAAFRRPDDSDRAISLRQALLPFGVLFAILPIIFVVAGWTSDPGEEPLWPGVVFCVLLVAILIYFAVGLPRWNSRRERNRHT
jgi:hypothetical protein